MAKTEEEADIFVKEAMSFAELIMTKHTPKDAMNMASLIMGMVCRGTVEDQDLYEEALAVHFRILKTAPKQSPVYYEYEGGEAKKENKKGPWSMDA